MRFFVDRNKSCITREDAIAFIILRDDETGLRSYQPFSICRYVGFRLASLEIAKDWTRQ